MRFKPWEHLRDYFKLSLLNPSSSPRGAESGASLVSILIALGLLSSFVVMSQQGWVNMTRSAKLITASQNFDQIDAIISRELTRIILEKGSCYRPEDFTIAMASSMGRLQTTVEQNIAANQSKVVLEAMDKASPVKQANERCRTQTTITNLSDPTQNATRFCLKINRDASASKNGILSAEGAFAEITILLKNNRTGQNMSCHDFLSSPHGGASIYYSYYWTTQIDRQLAYRQYNGFFLVSRGL